MDCTPYRYLVHIVASLLLIVLGIYLVPLLIQLRKTALALEELSKTASRDISRVAEDVHQIKGQVMQITTMIQEFLELPTSIAKSLQGSIASLPQFVSAHRNKLGILSVVIRGVKSLMSFFGRK